MGGGAGNGLNFGATYGSGQLPLEYAAKSTSAPEPTNDTSPTAKSARESLLAEAQTEKVKTLIKELYHTDGGIGDGGTADAIRHELATGEKVGGKTHIRKGRERLKQIAKMLRKDPDGPDSNLLRRLKADLENALGRTQ